MQAEVQPTSAIPEVILVFRPISPRQWRNFSHRLSNADGWVPPMMMIAAAGVILPLNVGVGQLGNAPLVRTLGLLTWTTWLIVGGIATMIVAFQSLYNLKRLGTLGLVRPRWWFEVARLLWITCLFSVLSMFIPFVLGAVGVRFGFLDQVFLLYGLVGFTFIAFFAAASVGYLLSFAQRWPRRGRAFECVHYFYTILGGIFLITWAALHWPAQAVWLNILIVLLGVTGVAVFTGGFISIIVRYEQNESTNPVNKR